MNSRSGAVQLMLANHKRATVNVEHERINIRDEGTSAALIGPFFVRGPPYRSFRMQITPAVLYLEASVQLGQAELCPI